MVTTRGLIHPKEILPLAIAEKVVHLDAQGGEVGQRANRRGMVLRHEAGRNGMKLPEQGTTSDHRIARAGQSDVRGFFDATGESLAKIVPGDPHHHGGGVGRQHLPLQPRAPGAGLAAGQE